MIFSYNWLKEYLKGRVPGPKELADVLMFHSFEVKGIEKKGGDWAIDIDVLPNRAHDCFSHIGVARECSAVLNSRFKIPSVSIFDDRQKLKRQERQKAKDFVTIEIENINDCPRYSATVITGVKVGQSPKWLQEKLKVCGLQAINNIVDITNYVMLETGQPLHAFDLDKISSKLKAQSSKPQLKVKSFKAIIVRRARKGERIKTLDDKTYTLDDGVLVIADEKKPIAIAGIKGGEATGIDKKTRTIVIEAANFNPVLTRKASQKLKLRTDASMRFEQGLDPNLIDFAQKRVCALVGEIAGGTVAKGLVDSYPKKLLAKRIQLDSRYVNRLLGVEIPKQKMGQILKNLGFKFHVSSFMFQVEVPTRRLDVCGAEDLIEEIGRLYGYGNIPSRFPAASLVLPKRNDDLFWEKNIKDILKEAGFYEAYGYSFCGEADKDIFNWTQPELVEIANPISSLNKYLRPSLIPNLIKVAKENLKNFSEVRIFELGHIFKKTKGVLEKKMLTGVLVEHGLKDDGFYILKGVVESLLNQLAVSDVWYDDVKPTPEDSRLEIWHPGKTAEIKANDREIGFLGQLHPLITDGFNIKEKVFLFDVDFGELLEVVSEEQEYQPISPYPAVLRDIALFVPVGTKTEDILNVIDAAGSSLVRDIDLFDVYSGQEVPEGQENFAFHIVYQSEEKTLSWREVDKVHQKIIKAIEENPEWEVRK